MTGEQQCGPRVQPQHLVHLPRRQLVTRPDVTEAGIVDQHIESAENADHLIQHGQRSVGLPEIGGHDQRVVREAIRDLL
jgi:hypothetical protein